MPCTSEEHLSQEHDLAAQPDAVECNQAVNNTNYDDESLSYLDMKKLSFRKNLKHRLNGYFQMTKIYKAYMTSSADLKINISAI